jgi:hypothetical protein
MNLWWCRVPAEPASMIGPSKHADRDPRRAWVAVALLPVALVLAMVVGEGLISVLGYQSGSQEPVPVGPALLAGVPALLILIAPGLAAVHYGRRGRRAGRREAIVPAWIGGVTAVVVVAQNVLAFLVGR